ncbi:MAG: AAA family ATPase [Promethearchaeota archaeon]
MVESNGTAQVKSSDGIETSSISDDITPLHSNKPILPPPSLKQRPAIRISKIILQNFLSFEHDEVILDPEFTIITGPNGAGKSTIYQALKFALGSNDYDGRYKRWGDFIRSEQNLAKVQVFFQTEEKGKVREIIIQRSVQKGSAPKHAIKWPEDPKIHPARAKMIEKFIEIYRIDPENVFAFMSQGNIDSIKDFKEKTLCEFVEHGIGIEVLHHQILVQKEKIRDLERDFQALLSQKDNLKYQLLELEPKLMRLQQKRKYLQKLEHLQEELLWAQRTEIQQQIRSYQQEIVKKQEEITTTSQRLDKIDTQIRELKKQNQNLTTQMQQLQADILTKQTRNKFITQELNSMAARKNQIADEIEQLGTNITKLNQELKTQAVEEYSAQKNLDNIGKIIIQTENSLQQLREEQNHLFQQLQTHQQTLSSFQQKTSELRTVQELLQTLQSQHEDYENQILNRVTEIARIQHELEQFKWFMKNPTPDLIDRMKKLKDQYDNSIQIYQRDLDELQIQHNHIAKTIENITRTVISKGMPKPKAIQQMIQEIRSRKLDCIGPLIDYISFDPLYQAAVESIFGSRVLYGFIAKNREAFAQLNSIAQRCKARCNLYQPRKNSIPQLQPLQNVGTEGIFGYLANKITPTMENEIINKVIHSVANRTIVVKDHIVGTSYIERYQYSSWIVTLDGEQIRPKKLVIEARPFIRDIHHSGITSVAQAKEKMHQLTVQAEENRRQYNQRQQDLKGKSQKLDILNQRLQQINELLGKYKQMEIKTHMKNSSIQKREDIYQKILEKQAVIGIITQAIDELKPSLPTDFLQKQTRLSQLPEVITKNQNDSNEYQITKQNYMSQLSDIRVKKASLDAQIKAKSDEKTRLEQSLQTRDDQFFTLFQENMTLKTDIEALEVKNTNRKQTYAQNEVMFEDLQRNREALNFEIIRIQAAIENYKNYIAEKEEKISIIRAQLQNSEIYLASERTFNEISIDIHDIEKNLIRFQDIDEGLLQEQMEIEAFLERIGEKQKILELEIKAARNAQNELEETYYHRFEQSITVLEESINEKFILAELNFQVALHLQGDIENLGLQISTTFKTDKGTVTYPMSALSGGQRSMVGICLMLSLNHLNPAPVNIYDECDMFLDDRNAQTVAKLIYNMARSGTQFILMIPSKQNILLQLANKVIGVSRNGKYGPSTVHYSQSRR